MRVSLLKLGRVLGLRLPKSIVEQMGLTAGETVSIAAEADRLLIDAAPARWTLEDMLVGMTPEAMSEAFDWGADQGREEVGG